MTNKQKNVAHQLNTHFINVGRNLSENLPPSDTNPTRHINQPKLDSFVFHGIYTYEARATQSLCIRPKYSISIFGFRNGNSKTKPINELADTLRQVINSNLYTCGTIADFLKAFNNVNHEMLLKKLEACSVRGLPLKWFSSYLMNRQQYNTLGNTELPSMQTMRNSPWEHTGTTSVFHLYK